MTGFKGLHEEKILLFPRPHIYRPSACVHKCCDARAVSSEYCSLLLPMLGYMFICGGDSDSQLKSSQAHCLPSFPQWTVGRPGFFPPATAMAHCLFGPIGEMGSGLVIQLRGLAQEQLHLGHHWRRCFSPQKTLDGFIRMGPGCCTGVQASNRSSP